MRCLVFGSFIFTSTKCFVAVLDVRGKRAKQIEESAADMQSRVEGFPSHPRSNEG